MVLTAGRRARRRGTIVLAALLVALVLLATYLTITLRYKLDHGNVWANPQALSSATAGPYHEYRYLAQPGRTIEYGFSIANRGPFTVRLEDVVKEGGPGFIVEQVYMNVAVHKGFQRGTAAPFKPIDLRPDDQIGVWVTMRFSDDFLLNYTTPCGGVLFRSPACAIHRPREAA